VQDIIGLLSEDYWKKYSKYPLISFANLMFFIIFAIEDGEMTPSAIKRETT